MNQEQLKDIIFDWLALTSKLPENQIIFSNQNVPSPYQTFIVINASKSVKNIGSSEQRYNADGTVTTIQVKECDMSITGYGKNALNILTDILDSLSLPDICEEFERKQISVVSENNEVRDLTYKENNEWQDKRMLEISAMYETFTTQDLGYFDKIELSGTIEADISIESNQPVLSGSFSHEVHEHFNGEVVEISLSFESIQDDFEDKKVIDSEITLPKKTVS